MNEVGSNYIYLELLMLGFLVDRVIVFVCNKNNNMMSMIGWLV